ncbi:hypothetical protein M1B35_31795 [Pseudomonas sp. MAFF 302046]|uniref:DUF4376 domain-containing protein n=1 Tax=Pseudomonas morbosilactucae TaxID=2938197 RepID=A0ABT0JRK3_9PSED|nr:hypothetical protein [Pseudomonas morbosilactucae]MCK9818582.1 hypothetical protein [Pseudomonas morbosilactucae]
MKYAYCPESQGLYRSDLNLTFPRDAIEITYGKYLELVGQEVALNDEGVPVVSRRGVSLDVLYSSKTQSINYACETEITAGFWSEALGTAHQYGSQLDDQLNLTGVILAGADSLYACRDTEGVKDFRPHTAAQLRQVGDDFTLYKLQLLQKANGLKQKLDEALANADMDALAAVTWDGEQ